MGMKFGMCGRMGWDEEEEDGGWGYGAAGEGGKNAC